MGSFFAIYLVTCIMIILGVEHVSSIILGREPRSVYDDEDVIGGYNFGRSRYFRQYPKFYRYHLEKLARIRANESLTEILSKPASYKTVISNALGSPSKIHSNETQNNTSEHVSDSAINTAGTGTEKVSKEVTDTDIHSPVPKDNTENLNDTTVSVFNTGAHLSSSTAAVTDSVTNLNDTTAQNTASETDSQDSTTVDTDSVTNSTDATTQNPDSETDLHDSTTENTDSVTNLSGITTQNTASQTDLKDSTTAGTESVTNVNDTNTEGIVSSTDFSDTTAENTAAETGISDIISSGTTSGTNASTEAVTENSSQSPTTEERSSPSSNIPETSQSQTDSTEVPSSQASKSTEGIISTTETQHFSSSTDETSTSTPIIPSNSNRIKVAVSVLFVIIAVMALGVLGTYIIRAKRETIHYDELRLLP